MTGSVSFSLAIVLLLGAQALAAKTPKPIEAGESSATTFGDKELAMKMCDPATSMENKEKVYKCMDVTFPQKVREAIEMCAHEVEPNAENRQQVAQKLCDDKKAKKMMENCLKMKSLSVLKHLKAKEAEEMTVKYRECAAKVFAENPKA